MTTMILLLLLAAGSQLAAPDRPPGSTPRSVRGDASANGVTITAPDDGFVVEIPGKSLKALSSARLVWQVDALTVELLVAPPSPLLPDAATGEAILRDYRRAAPGATDDRFTATQGITSVRWTVNDRTAAAAAVVGRRIVVLTASATSPSGIDGARAFLTSAIATLRPFSTSDSNAGPRRGLDPATSGATLQEQLRLQEALLGTDYVGLLSAQLGTETDKRVGAAIVMEQDALVEMARMLVGLGQRWFSVSVFDGRQAHAINITGFDTATRVFEYWDPWGQGSFLERGNNAAGVAARKHPTEARIWLMTFDELARILYSIVLPLKTVVGSFRLSTLAAGPPENLVATYRALHDTAPDLEELTAARLEKDAAYMASAGNPDVAAALVAVRASLYPTAPRTSVAVDAARIRTLAASTMPPAARPRTPQLLEVAKGQDFFTFFHLEQTGADGAARTFRPTSEKFRPLVEVKITTNPSGAITERELKIRGSFIDDRALTAFATDIVNSFLLFAVDPAEASRLAFISTELRRREKPRVPIPGARSSTATVPAIPSPAFLTYAGQHPAAELTLPSSQINLRNVGGGNQRELVITVTNR